MPHPNDLELARRVVQADRQAYEVLYERAYARALAYVRRRLGPEERVRVVLEASLVELFGSLPRYRGASSLDAVLFEIVRRRTANASATSARPLALAGRGIQAPAVTGRV
jgi:DNA-directed RNA polymerase specialized sigma24 family protein